MLEQKSRSPQIFDYLDVTLFLNAHFHWRKKMDDKFSYSAWSAELGMGSKTMLRFILKKKRSITARASDVFKSNLRLEGEERDYFDTLISYSQAKTVVEREAFGAKLIQLQRSRYLPVELSPTEATRHVFGPVILTLLTYKDFHGTVASISKLLNMDENEARSTLESLEAESLITCDESGRYFFQESSFRIPASLGHIGLRRFHEYWLGRAISAQDLPLETRRFRSLKFALNEEDFATAVEKINDYALSLLSKFDGDSLNGRQLYMFENALFPIANVYSRGSEET